MIFKISRTSIAGNYHKPCEEAFNCEVPTWQVRTCSEEEYNERFAKREGGLWKEKGTNHQITRKGYIKRQGGVEKCWCIKIDSMGELANLSKKYGQLVFAESEIEIYDTYRE